MRAFKVKEKHYHVSLTAYLFCQHQLWSLDIIRRLEHLKRRVQKRMHRQILVGSDMNCSEEQPIIALPWKEKQSLQLPSWVLPAGRGGMIKSWSSLPCLLCLVFFSVRGSHMTHGEQEISATHSAECPYFRYCLLINSNEMTPLTIIMWVFKLDKDTCYSVMVSHCSGSFSSQGWNSKSLLTCLFSFSKIQPLETGEYVRVMVFILS